MENEFTVYMNGQTAGNVKTEKRGLYYLLNCSCDPPKQIPYILVLRDGENTLNLGTCIPINGRFGLQTKLPVKSMPEGQWQFTLKPKYEAADDGLIPLQANEPFPYIDKLENACFTYINGQPGIVLRG